MIIFNSYGSHLAPTILKYWHLLCLRNSGLHLGGCGERTVRFRPALVFTSKHWEQASHIIDSVLSDMYKEKKY